MTKDYQETVEDVAGEIWRCIKEDFEREGLTLPDSWKGIGMAYGGYSRAIEKLTTYGNTREEEIIKIVEEYFEGLIHIPDPQATKESLIEAIKK
jgi:hypothetical protein